MSNINKEFNQAEYNKEYNKKHYKKVTNEWKFDEYDKIKNYCDDMNIPCATYIKMCCKYCIDNVHIDELKRYK